MRAVLIWAALGAVALVPLIVAAGSPLLAWRQPVYITAGLAGVIGLALMMFQPLLAAGLLPGLPRRIGRKLHLWSGGLLLVSVIVHVGGLWITSPPDVIDALLFRSPTPFSVWGVWAMWALFAAAMLALYRRAIAPAWFRAGHSALVLMTLAGTVVHALLIEGTMGTVSKFVLCIFAGLALAMGLATLRPWAALRRRLQQPQRSR